MGGEEGGSRVLQVLIVIGANCDLIKIQSDTCKGSMKMYFQVLVLPLLVHCTVVYHDNDIAQVDSLSPHIIYTSTTHQKALSPRYHCLSTSTTLLCSLHSIPLAKDHITHNDCTFTHSQPPSNTSTKWYWYDWKNKVGRYSAGLQVVEGGRASVVEPRGMSRMEAGRWRVVRREWVVVFRVMLVVGLLVLGAFLWWWVYGRRPRPSFVF